MKRRTLETKQPITNVIKEVITSPRLCKYVFMMNLLTIIDKWAGQYSRKYFLMRLKWCWDKCTNIAEPAGLLALAFIRWSYECCCDCLLRAFIMLVPNDAVVLLIVVVDCDLPWRVFSCSTPRCNAVGVVVVLLDTLVCCVVLACIPGKAMVTKQIKLLRSEIVRRQDAWRHPDNITSFFSNDPDTDPNNKNWQQQKAKTFCVSSVPDHKKIFVSGITLQVVQQNTLQKLCNFRVCSFVFYQVAIRMLLTEIETMNSCLYCLLLLLTSIIMQFWFWSPSG